jgi:predicted phosphodiesterase
MKLLILSDIHGNWPALEAVIQAEGSWDAVAFCGDVVDYGPHPAQCLRWVAEHAEYRVRGNHDNAVGCFADCRCMGSFRAYSVITRSWHQALLNDSDRNFLCGLPTLHWFEWQGRHFRMAHATPQGDMFEYLESDQWEQRVKGLESDFVLLGHTHVQGMRLTPMSLAAGSLDPPRSRLALPAATCRFHSRIPSFLPLSKKRASSLYILPPHLRDETRKESL